MLDFYKGKKVFITGHTGFKGSWLCEILLMAGADVKGYALPPYSGMELFSLLKLENRMKSVFANICDLERVKKEISEFKPEFVFHLAAQPLVRESYKKPVETYVTNVMGTVHILEACRQVQSVRSIVNVTTDKVYFNREREEGYKEYEQLCGYDPYSNSKSCSELITFSYKNSFYNQIDSPAISTARSGNVIGGGDFSPDRIIPDCVRATIKEESICIRNPHSTRPYQHVLDCLNGYLVLCERQSKDKTRASEYNFGPDDESCVSTRQLVSMFCKEWQDAKWFEKSDNGPHEANFLKLNCDKAKEALNWKPKLNIIQAIKLTVDWYKGYTNKEDVHEIIKKQIREFFKK